jgi:endonuclease-3 related protein
MRRPQLHEKALQSRRPASRDKAAASSRIKRIYILLLKAFGPQGWWPVTPAGARAPVYVPLFYGAPGEKGAFEICAGAILTQNTAWTNVEKALSALHAAGLMSAAAMAACPLPRLEAAIRSSGYYKQKARRLKEFCRRALREHPEGLRAWFAAAGTTELRAELLSCKGVGPETADSMALYAAGKAAFVIDAYTRRMAERAGLARGLSYDGWKALFEAALPPDVKVYNEYHALVVRLAKEFCRKSAPFCGGCPLNKVCEKRI